MKTQWVPLVAAVLIAFLPGCAEQRIPADEAAIPEDAADKSEVHEAPKASDTSPAAAPAVARSKDAVTTASHTATDLQLPSDVAGLVVGSDFTIEGTPAAADGEQEFTRPHYFEAIASVDLKSTSTLMETDLEGQNAKGAVPILGMYVQRENGERLFSNEGRPIDGPQLLKDKVQLGPGSYTIRFTYFKDSVGQIRPAITLRSITFRK